MSRILVIGDIHGALKALEQCLERANYNQEDDKLIFLGDYVDGWGESAQLIEYLIQLNENGNCVFIKGNHDVWCEDYLIFGTSPSTWVYRGGKATIESYSKLRYLSDSQHRSFFIKLHNYYIDDKNRAFIHGGFTSHKGIGHESLISNYYWDRYMWVYAKQQNDAIFENNALTLKWKNTLDKYNEIYIGHTSVGGGAPQKAYNVWNMDTGAGFEGKLTIMDIDTKEYWQSNFVRELYP